MNEHPEEPSLDASCFAVDQILQKAGEASGVSSGRTVGIGPGRGSLKRAVSQLTPPI